MANAEFLGQLNKKMPQDLLEEQIKKGWCFLDLPQKCYLQTFEPDRNGTKNKILITVVYYGKTIRLFINVHAGIVKITENELTQITG